MPRAMAEYDDHPNEHEPLTVWDEANAWVLRSQSRPLTEDERRQLADWRRGSPAHETELQNATRFWTLLDGLAGQVRRDHSTPSGPADRACFDHIHPQDARAAPQDRWARRFSMALAATLLIVVMAPLLWRTVDFWMSDYRTGTGERASVTLADGSVIHLNTRSAVSVELSDRRRNLTLKEGEALFEVAPDVERPFEVTADLGIIRAMGTVFDVYQHAGSTTVTVLEGSVLVLHDGTSHRLSAGYRMRYRADGFAGGPEPADLRKTVAWRRGEFIFENLPLVDVVEELNRYRAGRIMILDPRMRPHQLSGSFDLNEPDAAISILQQVLPIHATRITPYLIFLMAR
ncbi:MAG TPA: FecR family protein [Nitrospiraceae bacterium]|nr:FecR family protein [Nitrospiraceae bacterium]